MRTRSELADRDVPVPVSGDDTTVDEHVGVNRVGQLGLPHRVAMMPGLMELTLAPR